LSKSGLEYYRNENNYTFLLFTERKSLMLPSQRILIKRFSTMRKTIINTPDAPAPIGPYSQAVQAGDWLFISGQIAINPSSGDLNIGNIQAETTQVMENLKAILTEAKCTFNNVVKTTIFLSEMEIFSAVNEIYGSYFTGEYPARETLAVKTLPKNVNVEISMVAIANK